LGALLKSIADQTDRGAQLKSASTIADAQEKCRENGDLPLLSPMFFICRVRLVFVVTLSLFFVVTPPLSFVVTLPSFSSSSYLLSWSSF
jgi:hypothetical protein